MSKFVLWFVKITGWIPNLLYLRRKTYYKNNNKTIKKRKEPAVIISNHTSLMDFPLYMYTFMGSTIRPLVAEVTYNKNWLMRVFLKLIGGIKVDRDNYDFSFMGECINALEKKHSVLIFPEGRLPKKEEKELLSFKPSFVYIALESDTPIIPVYTNGKYGLKGKTRVIIGEKIYVNDLMDENKSTEENINNICNYFRDYIIKLRDELNEKEKGQKSI
jgi:1-acyl-sn-glycerol-3-phosphate acyltransferase